MRVRYAGDEEALACIAREEGYPERLIELVPTLLPVPSPDSREGR